VVVLGLGFGDVHCLHQVRQGLIEDSSDSAISIQAILDVVAAVRSGMPLVGP